MNIDLKILANSFFLCPRLFKIDYSNLTLNDDSPSKVMDRKVAVSGLGSRHFSVNSTGPRILVVNLFLQYIYNFAVLYCARSGRVCPNGTGVDDQ